MYTEYSSIFAFHLMISKSLAATAAELILSAKPDSSISIWKKKEKEVGTNTSASHREEVLKTKHAHPLTSIK